MDHQDAPWQYNATVYYRSGGKWCGAMAAQIDEEGMILRTSWLTSTGHEGTPAYQDFLFDALGKCGDEFLVEEGTQGYLSSLCGTFPQRLLDENRRTEAARALAARLLSGDPCEQTLFFEIDYGEQGKYMTRPFQIEQGAPCSISLVSGLARLTEVIRPATSGVPFPTGECPFEVYWNGGNVQQFRLLTQQERTRELDERARRESAQQEGLQ